MKQRITLLSFIFFFTLLSFSQRKELKDNRFDERYRIESQIKNLDRDENIFSKDPLFNKSRGVFRNSKLNSSQSTSSPLVIKYGLDYEISQSWDEISSQWVNDLKIEYTYDSNGNLAQYIVAYWGGLWYTSVKTEYTYDSNGNLTQDIYYLWDEQWGNDTKSEYTYDTNGNLTQTINSGWDGSQWYMYGKVEYTYDTNNNLTEYISYGWDGSLWYTSDKTEYTYDSNWNLTQYIYYWWDVGVSQWIIYTKNEYTYDSNGNLTQYVGFWWDLDSSQWVHVEKTDYTYDTNINLSQYIDYWWDGSQWVNEWKTDFTYNNSYSFSDLILPFFYSNTETKIFFNHMMTNGIGYVWDWNLNDWGIRNNFDFSYSEQDILSISEIIEEQLKIYPNPVSNILTIKSDIVPIYKVEIYSVLGKKIKEINSDFENINTGDLSKGIYLLRINSEKGTTIKKLIKK